MNIVVAQISVEFEMKRLIALPSVLGLVLALAAPAVALPGQRVEDVTAWIKAHDTLRPTRNERLIVRKSDSAAQRFTFESSLYAPGAFSADQKGGSRIRSESLQLFDMQNGVTKARLVESLRAIYGLDVTQDFDRAQTVYTYPTAALARTGPSQGKLTVGALQGEIRKGSRYAYWVEIANTDRGMAYSGRVTVFQHQDIDKLEAEIRNR
jgi:hypothetical protein